MNIDSILAKNDLVEWVEKAGGKPKRSQGGYHCACPLHRGDNSTGFSIYSENGKQHWKCFTRDCGGGDVIDFIMAWRGLPFPKAIDYLGGCNPIDRVEMARIASERAERAAKELEAQIKKATAALAELRQAQAWIKYHEQLEASPEARQLWEERGIPEVWQDLWSLGYTQSFTVNCAMGRWTTPTLSIPIFAEGQPCEPVNLRHRLLNPPTPTDKYRPDRAGLSASPFICAPDKTPDNVLITEGEIKAMVTYLTLDSPKWQVMGIPGKKIFKDLLPQLQGRQVVILLDPDAQQEAETMAREIGGRVVDLYYKVDDAILRNMLDRDQLRQLVRTARKVK